MLGAIVANESNIDFEQDKTTDKQLYKDGCFELSKLVAVKW